MKRRLTAFITCIWIPTRIEKGRYCFYVVVARSFV